MSSKLAHMQMNVNRDHLDFYKDLATSVGWTPIHEDDGMLGVAASDGTSIWFVDMVNDVYGDYDGCGLNHIAFGVDSVEDVDKAAAWLTERGIEHLFGTPRHRPEFSADDTNTYYQVMFESPDKLLFEVVTF